MNAAGSEGLWWVLFTTATLATTIVVAWGWLFAGAAAVWLAGLATRSACGGWPSVVVLGVSMMGGTFITMHLLHPKVLRFTDKLHQLVLHGRGGRR